MLTTDRSSSDPNDADAEAARPDVPDVRASGAAMPGARRLLVHHLLLALVLAAVLPIAGTGSVWSADEGALLYQAVSVAEGRGWTFPHPFPEADPDGGWFPIHLAGHADGGRFIVLGKHATFVRLTGAVHGIGGYAAVLALSATAGLAAAAAAARLARRLDRRAAVPALWLTGVASPLFLSAYVAWAHTLGAALVGWALVGLTSGRAAPNAGPAPLPDPGSGSDDDVDRSPTRARIEPPNAAQLAGALALGGAVLVRTEAALAAAAVTAALGWPTARALWRGRMAWRSGGSPAGIASAPPARSGPGPSMGGTDGRPSPPAAATPAVLAGLATVAGFAIDRITSVERLGPVRSPGDRWGGLPGRLDAFTHTWLRPDFSRDPQHLLLLVSAGLVVGAGVAARRRRPDHPLIGGLLAAAVAALALRFALSPTALIPGLVVAFPLLFAGLTLVWRSDLVGPPTGELPRTLLLTTVLFWSAVAATQYRHGGGGEWGGRYFALALPAVVPVATTALVRALEPAQGRARRRLVGLGVALAVLPVTMGILGLADARSRTEALATRVDQSLVAPGDGDDRPVVLTTLDPMGRWAWDDVDRSRWLLVATEELPEAGARLLGLGIERLTVVTGDADTDLEILAPWYEPIVELPPSDAGPIGLDRVVIQLRARG